jgi:hypothetical protein
MRRGILAVIDLLTLPRPLFGGILHTINSRWFLVLLLFPLLFVSPRAQAQGITTGTITGTVVDPQGAVVQNAKITATNSATGVVLNTTSEGDGSFSFRAVPIGTYRIEINAQGFTPATLDKVPVASGVDSDLKEVSVKIGSSEVVQVSGSGTDLLNPADSQVTTTFQSGTLETLPLNNGFDTITEVIPGVVSTHGDNFSNTNGDNFSVNGQSGRNNNFELDGQSNNDNSVAGPQIFFGNQDAIQEIQVVTDDYSAQYGRNAGAVVNYITKSGTNQLHGSAFELYQGQALSSMTNGDKSPLFGYCAPGQSASSGCATPVIPRYVENRYGATIGGPILRDKLFFFGSTFWDRLFTGVVPSQSLPDLTPTPAGLATLAAAFPGNPGVAIAKAAGPYGVTAGNPSPIASSITTENITGPGDVTVPVQFAGVTRSISTPFTDEEDLGRIDWQPDGADHFFARYFYQTELSSGIGANSVAAGDYVNVPDTNYSVGADWSHTFSINWVDQLRYSFQESKVGFEGGSLPNCTISNLTACTTDVDFIGSNFDTSFGIGAAFPQGRTVKVTQIQNNATWAHGKQTILFGGEFDYQNSPNVFLPLYNGILLYDNFSSFLQDSGLMELANGNPVIPFTEPDAAAYVEDDWKVTPNFTAHLGLRWEYFGQAVNELHSETVTRESNPSTAFWDPTLPLADRTVPSVAENYHNFEPRIGFAWNPSFDQKLVVNGGYAINANPAFYNIFLIDAIASPVANTGVIGCAGNCQPASGNPSGAAIRAQNLPSLPTGPGVDPRFRDETYVPTNFRTPYVQSWTLALQHQLGRAAVGEIRYVGVKTTDNFQSINANPYLAPVATAFPGYSFGTSLCTDTTAPGYGRPSCNNANLALVTNGGWQNYGGLDLNLTTSNYHGLTGTFSYTFSREVDNVTDVFGTGAAGSTTAFSQNPLNTNTGERGVDGNSYPNVVGLSFRYAFPQFAKNNGLLSRIVNGFELTSLYRYNSGQPFNATQPLTLDPNTGYTSFCDGTFNASSVGPDSDTCRLVLSNPKAPLNTVAYLNAFTGPLTANGPTTGAPVWVLYNSDGYSYNTSGAVTGYNPGTPTTPSAAHWIINNQAYALSVGNPYPGSGRNNLRGDSFSDFDVNLFKNIPITERVRLQLQFDAYNALNQMFRGTGIANVADYTPGVAGSTNAFLSTAYNVDGNVPGDTSGQRFVVLGGKVLF